MEVISQIINPSDDKVKHANYIYTVISKLNSEYSPDGFLVSRFKLKNNNHYNIFVVSNSKPTSINTIVNLTNNKFELIDDEMFEEFFLNGMDCYLRFDSEAYFRIVCEENPEEVKFIFTDYSEAFEYLQLIEENSTGN